MYDVKDGRLVNVRPNSDHPVTRHNLCVKLKDYHDHHYNPDRVLYPLARRGPKGSRRFERITWDEALNTIEKRWTGIIDTHGPQAILPYCYLGNEGSLQGLTSGDAFFNRLGATVCEKTFCASGSSTAWLMTVGPTGGVDPESFVYAKYIVVWACNVVSTNLHLWPFILEARKKGAKLVVIDSYKSRTAKEADWHIAPRPGTDGALAMGLINAVIQQNRVDREYVEKYTVGYEDLKVRAEGFPPEYVEKITGVASADVVILAREFASTQPSVIRFGVALERHRGGGQTIRAVCCLPALVGSWRHVGGGLLQVPLWEFPMNWDKMSRPDWIRPGTRVINSLRLGASLTGGLDLDPPIMSLMVYNTNPVSQAPEAGKIVEGLKREDLFMIASEHFVTDTASYADIVLPATMAAEHDDLMFSWGHFYLTLNQKAIDAPGEAVPNTELFRRLAKTMGFEDEHFKMSDRELMELYLDWKSPQLKGIDMHSLGQSGFARLQVGSPKERAPHREGHFPTPSGKCEFLFSAAKNGNFVAPPFRQMYTEMQGGEPVDPLPGYLPGSERAETDPEPAERYPLNLLSPKSHGFLNSSYANEEHKIKVQGKQFVLIHPQDAGARGIGNGSGVRVFNARGEFTADARVTDDVSPGVVVAPSGYWPRLNRTYGSVNHVSSDHFSNLGHAPTFSDNRVQVERDEEE